VPGTGRERKVVQVRSFERDVTEELPYDALVLSPGARPVRPPIPGIERAFSLRSVEDTDAIVAAVDGARTAAVIGGGFIGIEMAENLVRRGMAVAIVEATAQVMAPLDPEMVEPVHAQLRGGRVALHLESAVTGIESDAVILSTGERLPADVVIAAIGVRPETGLAVDAGLAIGPRGGIAVDDTFRTSDPAIFAVGDAVEKRDALDGSDVLVPLANTANRQGRFVADVIAVPGTDQASWERHRGASTWSRSPAGTRSDCGPPDECCRAIHHQLRVARHRRATGGLTASRSRTWLAHAPQFVADPVNMLGYVDDTARRRH
jgi:NADPH-dependent 2,4-dienoyl-CoA reductase/sulfur reductase-like enzyme